MATEKNVNTASGSFKLSKVGTAIMRTSAKSQSSDDSSERERYETNREGRKERER